MREITAAAITDCVRRLCLQANRRLPADAETEPWPVASGILGELCANLDAARETELPICQDTGLVTVFAELGEDAHVSGFEEAVQEGVRRGYAEGYLRKSVVRDPLRRGNTGDNTPATIYLRLVPGDRLRLTVAPKGAGSENMCAVKMLTPADGEEGVRSFVLDVVKHKMERELLEAINATGIGPQGLGGRTTALAVRIKAAPTHIAMLPAAVCISCHALRHATEVI